MKANHFRVVPLPSEVAEEARRQAAAVAPAHRISVVDAPNSAPCRHCLRYAEPGERVILFPYQAIPRERPYGECGPIFVHAESCARYAAPEIPTALRAGRVLRAYNSAHEIVAAEVANGAPEEVAARLLENPEVKFLHARSVTQGCYTFTLERA